MTLAERCRVVLVRPSVAANIGATARVMRNFGLQDLRLVAPEADPLDEQSKKLSTHGEWILHAARRHADLIEAVADCVLVIGTSARSSGVVRSTTLIRPDEAMARIIDVLPSGPAALVFGPEKTGLLNEEVTRCHFLLNIPTDEDYPALNLAQSVAICLYELRKAWLSAAGEWPLPREIAPAAAQERMFAQLSEALRDLHFLWGENAGALMHAVRHLLSRAQPTPQEVDLLFGLARQIRWFTRQQRGE